MAPELRQYEDLLANVRRDGRFHSIRDLVRPNDPLVAEVSVPLLQAPNFIEAAQDFVSEFTDYTKEIGDYWSYPHETLAYKNGDCDCLAILLCSILRNGITADRVFCAIGTWQTTGKPDGHMWILYFDPRGNPRPIEATAPYHETVHGLYQLSAIFNDEYAFSTDHGLSEFGLMPFEVVLKTLEDAGALLVPVGA
jgi:hypothetical protein